MDEQLAEYQQKIEKVVALKASTTPGQYLSYLTTGYQTDDGRIFAGGGDFTTMITVKGHAGRMLSEEDRALLKKCGLTVLSEIGDKDSYIGIIENGNVKYEGSFREDGSSKGSVHRNKDKTIDYTGRFPKGKQYTLISGSKNQGDISSCQIGAKKTEYSYNERGINIVVYDNDAETISDDTYFNTWDYSERESYDTEAELKKALEEDAQYADLSDGLKKLYLYNKRVQYYRESKHLMMDLRATAREELFGDSEAFTEADQSGADQEKESEISEVTDDEDSDDSDISDAAATSDSDDISDASLTEEQSELLSHTGLSGYLSYFMNKENLVIYISVKGDASPALSEADRAMLKSLGLEKLSELEAGDGYIGVIEEGMILHDISKTVGASEAADTSGEDRFSLSALGYDIMSGGVSHIIINQKEYSPDQDGVNIVIYDKELQMVADTQSF